MAVSPLIQDESIIAAAAKKQLKRDKKKREIALSATEVLKTRGYAHTSLRDISKELGVSLGILHYYFDGRDDLLNFCVREYKKEFTDGLLALLEAEVADNTEMLQAFSSFLAVSVTQSGQMHNLWYDLRNQAMFTEELRDSIVEIEDQMISAIDALLKRTGSSALAGPTYAAVDGLFTYYLSCEVRGRPVTEAEVAAGFTNLIARLVS